MQDCLEKLEGFREEELRPTVKKFVSGSPARENKIGPAGRNFFFRGNASIHNLKLNPLIID